MVRRRYRWPIVPVLLGLLLLGHVQHGLTVVGAIWWTVPSWDNPATHAFETLASIIPPVTDPTRQVREETIAAACLLERLPPPEGQPARPTAALSGRISRSPPARRVV